MQEEEPGEPERVDHPQLLGETRMRRPVVAWIAHLEHRPAQLGQLARRLRILRPRIAVAEVLREVEPQPLRQLAALLDRRARGPRSGRPSPRETPARARCCRAARAPTRPASGDGGARRTRPAAARGCARARGRCRSPPWARRSSARAAPANGCARGRGAGTAAAARPADGRARRRRATAAASARHGRRDRRTRSGRRGRPRTPPRSKAAPPAAARADRDRSHGRA